MLHYDTLGYVVVGAMIITVVMMYFINEQVSAQGNGDWLGSNKRIDIVPGKKKDVEKIHIQRWWRK